MNIFETICYDIDFDFDIDSKERVWKMESGVLCYFHNSDISIDTGVRK